MGCGGRPDRMFLARCVYGFVTVDKSKWKERRPQVRSSQSAPHDTRRSKPRQTTTTGGARCIIGGDLLGLFQYLILVTPHSIGIVCLFDFLTDISFMLRTVGLQNKIVF